MSELKKREASSRYDCMTTEELQEILRKHAHGELETEPDTDELFIIMEVLSERRQNAGFPAFHSDERAYDEFCEHYMPKEQEKPRPNAIGFPNQIFKTVAAVLAVVLVLTVGTTITAKAFRIDIWSRFANWTKEVFQFSDGEQGTIAEQPKKENNLELKSLQDALAKENITEKLVPMWLPGEYKYKNLDVRATPKVRTFYAVFENKNEDRLIINIRQTIGVPAKQVEKNDDLFEIYTKDRINYYVFSNNAKLQTKWSIGEFECIIIGQITLDEMKAMIDSI